MSDSFRSSRRYSRILLTLAWSAGAGAPAAPGAVHRLSDGQSFSTIELGYSKPALTPDGKRVVYCQNAETAGAFALWSVRLAGGAPVRLSGALAGGGLACWFRISPDGTRVVYLANQDAPSTYELYSAPIDGSALAVKLNPELVKGSGNVSSDFTISPDSSTVVYRADQVVNEQYEIWSVPIGGGTAVQVNGNLTSSGGDVTRFEISPTGLQVIYLADQLNDEVFQVYGASIAGGIVEWGTLISAGIAAGDIVEFKLTEDGSHVVARGDRGVDDRFELYRAATDYSPGVTTLGVTPVANGDVLGFAISPDDQFVVYIADLNFDGVVELFSFPTDSSGGVGHQTLSGSMVAGGDVDNAFLISPDSAYAVYVADAAFDGQYEVHAVFPSGGTGFPLNASLPGGSSVAFDPLITSDSARVVYRVIGGFGLGATDIYGAPIDGGSSNLLNPVPPSGSWTALRQVATAGGAHVFFEFQTTDDSATRIYRAAVAGGELIDIGPVLDIAAGEAFYWLGPTATARQALFVSNEQTVLETELYAGDICVLCDGFDSATTTRWSTVLP